MAKQKIVVFGASGNLGRLIVQHLLRNPDVDLRIPIRSESRDKLGDLASTSAEIVELDLATARPEELGAVLAGTHCVISAVQGGPDIIIEAQTRMLEAARDAGVTRFIPSTFSYDIFSVAPGRNLMTDQRRAFAQIADRVRGDVEVNDILIGIFMDLDILRFVGALDLDKAESRFWGYGSARMDLTTYDDAAAYAAAVAVDPRPLARVIRVAGSSLDFAEFTAVYERVAGRRVNVRHMGSLDDLSQTIDERFAADPGNVFSYLPLMYWRATLDGSAAFTSVMNANFPTITPTTFERFVEQQLAVRAKLEADRVSEETLGRAIGV